MNGTGRSRRPGLGAVAGVLAAATALGVGQLVAGLTGANGSPVVAVGQLQIDFTPPWLKNFAISEFGSDDKLVLVCGILVVLAIFAAVIGALATRRLAYGMAGLGVFAVVGLIAAATRPTATVASALPTLAATAAAVIVLRILIGRANQSPELAKPTWSDSWGDAWAITGPAGSSTEDGTEDIKEPVPPDLPVPPDFPPDAGRPPSGAVIRPSGPRGPARPRAVR